MIFPAKKYKIIYADPPWQYRDKALSGRRGAGCKYPVQSDRWIADLPVKDIAEEDCCLFLWATCPLLPGALAVLNSWGFAFRTAAFIWIKRGPKGGRLAWGMGNWTRANAEICLLGIRGKPKRINASIHSVIEAPRGRHSAKPTETRDRIVALIGDLPRVELFARERVPGWEAWGNEI